MKAHSCFYSVKLGKGADLQFEGAAFLIIFRIRNNSVIFKRRLRGYLHWRRERRRSTTFSAWLGVQGSVYVQKQYKKLERRFDQ